MTAANIDQNRPNVAEMVVIHKIFRREFALLPGLVRGAADGDSGRATVLAKHTRLMLDGLHDHHVGEDDLLWPKLEQRVPEALELISEMEGQHKEIARLIGRITEQVADWAAQPDARRRDQLAASLDALRAPLTQHLDEEEARALPVISEHITPAEWNEIGERARAATPRDKLPILFGAILEDATAQERVFMLKPIPFPIKLLLTTLGARQYRRYITEVRSTAASA